MKALSFTSDGDLRPRVPLEALSTLTKAHAKEHPKATIGDLAGKVMLHWALDAPEGQLTIEEVSGEVRTLDMPAAAKRTYGALFADLPCTVRFAPIGQEGLTVRMTPSGAYAVAPGAQANAPVVLPDPPGATELERAARAWLRDGRVGSSSYALCVGLTGVTDPQHDDPSPTDVPWDLEDFRRCQEFFKAVPDALPRISAMAQKSRFWAPLALNWTSMQRDWEAGNLSAVRQGLTDALTPLRGQSIDVDDVPTPRKFPSP